MLASPLASSAARAIELLERAPGSGNTYSFVETMKLLNSSKYIADCVAAAKSARTCATDLSCGTKKNGITGSAMSGSRLKE